MTRPRHLPLVEIADPERYDTCASCGDAWPCRDERIDRIVDTLPSATELPSETRSKLLILLRPAAASL